MMRTYRDKNERVFGVNKDWLCHYTSMNNLCSILSTMSLRVSSYERSNDIAELEGNIAILLRDAPNEIANYVTKHCGYISFSHNFVNDYTYMGYCLPSMWGLYADGSRGACIVIDEDALIRENQSLLSASRWSKFINVDYKDWQSLKVVPNLPIDKVIEEHNEIVFGKKHRSWAHESERRFIGENLPHSLSLKNGVIKGIVIGCRSTEDDKQRILRILSDPNLACYNQIDKKSWVWQEPLGIAVFTSELGTYFECK